MPTKKKALVAKRDALLDVIAAIRDPANSDKKGGVEGAIEVDKAKAEINALEAQIRQEP